MKTATFSERTPRTPRRDVEYDTIIVRVVGDSGDG
jgi:hypothetical protein